MRMEINIYSTVNVKSQVGNIWDITTTQKVQSQKKSARDLKNLWILPENSAEDLGSRRLLLVLCIYL